MKLFDLTPEQCADFILSLCANEKPDPRAVRDSFRQQASTLRYYAAKAEAKGGTFQGFTVEYAEERAKKYEHLASTVPGILSARLAQL